MRKRMGVAPRGVAMGVAPLLLAVALAHGAELDIAECRFPDPPEIPDATQATESIMAQAGSDVREFVAGIQTSLECLESEEQSLGEEITEEQQAQLLAIYNNGVDQLNTMVEKYNEQVRIFKEAGEE